MVALLFNVNTKLSVSFFFDKLNENSRQASSCNGEAWFLLMYNV